LNRVVETWEMAGVGPVAVAVSDRAKYARISIRRDGAVKLILPKHVSLRQGRKFLDSGREWIKRHVRQCHAEQTDPALDRFSAGRLLVERLRQLAAAHGFAYNRVSVKSQKTLWGSCSSRNNINLNVNLVRLPEELRDYVLAHELVHTRHRNHSPAFWKELDTIIGDSKALRRKLRKYKPQV
jgi:predicted metal-dependent hydrolase